MVITNAQQQRATAADVRLATRGATFSRHWRQVQINENDDWNRELTPDKITKIAVGPFSKRDETSPTSTPLCAYLNDTISVGIRVVGKRYSRVGFV